MSPGTLNFSEPEPRATLIAKAVEGRSRGKAYVLMFASFCLLSMLSMPLLAACAAPIDLGGSSVGSAPAVALPPSAKSGSAQVLDPEAHRFNARATLGYIAAKKIPDVCAKLFCYCGCDLTDNHASLIDCFTSDHAGDCPICVDEAVLAYKMVHDDKPLAEIQKTIDLKFVPDYNEIFDKPSEALLAYRAHRLWKPTPAEAALERLKSSEIEHKSAETQQSDQANGSAKPKAKAKPGSCCARKHKDKQTDKNSK